MMNLKCGMRNSECGARQQAPRRSACAHSAFPTPQSAFPRGLTLVELLVTIVIMVTVLGAVIPLMSPNNNDRKVREAARQLNSLIQQAQAIAAREGRPAGIAFREFGAGSPYSGMALEAFLIAEPPPFAGFSPSSRIAIADTPWSYGSTGSTTNTPNGGALFIRNCNGWPVYQLSFIVNIGAGPVPDPFPPRMLRIGDTIDVGGNLFLICDDDKSLQMPNQLDDDEAEEYLASDPSATTTPRPGDAVDCIWLNGDFDPVSKDYRRALSFGSSELYAIRRQPANTSDEPMQFPRGVGIDMQGSGPVGVGVRNDFDSGIPDLVGIMFGPSGEFEGLYVNSEKFENVSNIFLLLGMFENGNPNQREEDFDFIANPIAPGDDDLLAQRRSRINWLSPDSRWVSLNRAGRVVVSEVNSSFDPSSPEFLDPIREGSERKDYARDQLFKQILFSRAYAAQMQSEGGR